MGPATMGVPYRAVGFTKFAVTGAKPIATSGDSRTSAGNLQLLSGLFLPSTTGCVSCSAPIRGTRTGGSMRQECRKRLKAPLGLGIGAEG